MIPLHVKLIMEFVILLQLYEDGGFHPMYGSHLPMKRWVITALPPRGYWEGQKYLLLEDMASCTVTESSLEVPDLPSSSQHPQFLQSESQYSGERLRSFTLLFRPQVHKMALIKISQLNSASGSHSGICRGWGEVRVLLLFFSLNPKIVSPLPFRDTEDKFPHLFQDTKLLVSFQPMCMFVHSTLIKLSSITPLEMLLVSCCEADWYKALFHGFSN